MGLKTLNTKQLLCFHDWIYNWVQVKSWQGVGNILNDIAREALYKPRKFHLPTKSHFGKINVLYWQKLDMEEAHNQNSTTYVSSYNYSHC